MNCSSYKNRALQEAQEIFGVDFDPEEFEDLGPEEEEDFDDEVSSCVGQIILLSTINGPWYFLGFKLLKKISGMLYWFSYFKKIIVDKV